jgi:hypothetical protein
MKPFPLLFAFSLGASVSAFAAEGHDHAHEHKPLHGGVVVEANHMDYELVARPDKLQLYLRDHGKPVAVTQASAKVTLLAGKEKQEAMLKPAGDSLAATGAFKTPPGAKAVALVQAPGKPAATVRFVLR